MTHFNARKPPEPLITKGTVPDDEIMVPWTILSDPASWGASVRLNTYEAQARPEDPYPLINTHTMNLTLEQAEELHRALGEHISRVDDRPQAAS